MKSITVLFILPVFWKNSYSSVWPLQEFLIMFILNEQYLLSHATLMNILILTRNSRKKCLIQY